MYMGRFSNWIASRGSPLVLFYCWWNSFYCILCWWRLVSGWGVLGKWWAFYRDVLTGMPSAACSLVRQSQHGPENCLYKYWLEKKTIKRSDCVPTPRPLLSGDAIIHCLPTRRRGTVQSLDVISNNQSLYHHVVFLSWYVLYSSEACHAWIDYIHNRGTYQSNVTRMFCITCSIDSTGKGSSEILWCLMP